MVGYPIVISVYTSVRFQVVFVLIIEVNFRQLDITSTLRIAHGFSIFHFILIRIKNDNSYFVLLSIIPFIYVEYICKGDILLLDDRLFDIHCLIFLQVYLCEKLSLVNEMYFAITLDRKTAGPVSFLCQYIGFNLLYVISQVLKFL